MSADRWEPVGFIDLSTAEKMEAYKVWRDLPKHEWECALVEECVYAFVKYDCTLDDERIERIEAHEGDVDAQVESIEWLAFLCRHPELSNDFYGLEKPSEAV